MPSAFLERTTPPDERALASVLGKASALWTRLCTDLAAELPALHESWSFSGKKHGWILKLSQKKKAVVYLIPGPGHFVASFALSEKACAAARRSDLPAVVRAAVDRAPTYAEGRGVRLEVRARKDLASVEKLVALKTST